MCLVRVLLSLQVWVKVVGTAVSPVGFPEGALLFIRVYNKIAGEFYWERSDGPEEPLVMPD